MLRGYASYDMKDMGCRSVNGPPVTSPRQHIGGESQGGAGQVKARGMEESGQFVIGRWKEQMLNKPTHLMQ